MSTSDTGTRVDPDKRKREKSVKNKERKDNNAHLLCKCIEEDREQEEH
jgi:hypothetical protein